MNAIIDTRNSQTQQNPQIQGEPPRLTQSWLEPRLVAVTAVALVLSLGKGTVAPPSAWVLPIRRTSARQIDYLIHLQDARTC